ncbi:hypothetical protein Scep_002893 [Stephania cephalantha]|uniref:Squalene cyclase C-terminal domain-containing protein n=1 Tax=Stephania cephalantha TaxID=152367 RepID=A0AAP0LCE5_9MAGN
MIAGMWNAHLWQSRVYIHLRNYAPDHSTKEIEACIGKAVNFFESLQRNDGSWSVTNSLFPSCSGADGLLMELRSA